MRVGGYLFPLLCRESPTASAAGGDGDPGRRGGGAPRGRARAEHLLPGGLEETLLCLAKIASVALVGTMSRVNRPGIVGIIPPCCPCCNRQQLRVRSSTR
jgi:hypothetical protein